MKMNTTEIEQAFEEINAARIAMSEATAELRQELEEPQLRIASIEAEISDYMAPYAETIDALKLDIEIAVLINEESCKTDVGTCTYVKGRKPAVKWDDPAIQGAIAGANGNLDFLYGFRTEGNPGQPSTRFKMIEID
jgi:hypothetical protein